MPAEVWRKMMLVAHGTSPPRDFSWMPPPAPATTDDTVYSGEPDAEAAGDDPRANFYDNLANDFGKAGGQDANDTQPQQDAAPDDTTVPAPDRYGQAPVYDNRRPYRDPPPAGDEPAYRRDPGPRYNQDDR